MKHRGYEIVKVKHPTPFNPIRESYDIVDGQILCKANVATISTAKTVIDTMIKYGFWQDKSSTV